MVRLFDQWDIDVDEEDSTNQTVQIRPVSGSIASYAKPVVDNSVDTQSAVGAIGSDGGTSCNGAGTSDESGRSGFNYTGDKNYNVDYDLSNIDADIDIIHSELEELEGDFVNSIENIGTNKQFQTRSNIIVENENDATIYEFKRNQRPIDNLIINLGKIIFLLKFVFWQ